MPGRAGQKGGRIPAGPNSKAPPADRPRAIRRQPALDPFRDLREFYRRFEEILPGPDLPPPGQEGDPGRPPPGNPCGACGDCCRWFFYLSRHEWEYLVAHLERQGRPVPACFRVAVTSEEDERLQFSEWRCPLWKEGVGRVAYEVRPLACRLAGPYLPQASKLPEGCAFQYPVRYSTVEGIPLWEEYVAVLRRHPSRPGYLAPCP